MSNINDYVRNKDVMDQKRGSNFIRSRNTKTDFMYGFNPYQSNSIKQLKKRRENANAYLRSKNSSR